MIVRRTEVDDSIRDNPWRLTEFVGRNVLEEFWFDPDDQIRWAQRTFDVFHAHLALGQVSDERSCGEPFISGDTQIIKSEGTILEM